MTDAKIDPSLAEVREWRESLQKELSLLDSKAELQEIHRRAQNLMRSHGLELKTVESRSRKEVTT